VVCISLAVGMCLPSPCLAMSVSSDSTIAASRHHVIMPLFLFLSQFRKCWYSFTQVPQEHLWLLRQRANDKQFLSLCYEASFT
jgi:hypothetical protein